MFRRQWLLVHEGDNKFDVKLKLLRIRQLQKRKQDQLAELEACPSSKRAHHNEAKPAALAQDHCESTPTQRPKAELRSLRRLCFDSEGPSSRAAQRSPACSAHLATADQLPALATSNNAENKLQANDQTAKEQSATKGCLQQLKETLQQEGSTQKHGTAMPALASHRQHRQQQQQQQRQRQRPRSEWHTRKPKTQSFRQPSLKFQRPQDTTTSVGRQQCRSPPSRAQVVSTPLARHNIPAFGHSNTPLRPLQPPGHQLFKPNISNQSDCQTEPVCELPARNANKPSTGHKSSGDSLLEDIIPATVLKSPKAAAFHKLPLAPLGHLRNHSPQRHANSALQHELAAARKRGPKASDEEGNYAPAFDMVVSAATPAVDSSAQWRRKRCHVMPSSVPETPLTSTPRPPRLPLTELTPSAKCIQHDQQTPVVAPIPIPIPMCLEPQLQQQDGMSAEPGIQQGKQAVSEESGQQSPSADSDDSAATVGTPHSHVGPQPVHEAASAVNRPRWQVELEQKAKGVGQAQEVQHERELQPAISSSFQHHSIGQQPRRSREASSPHQDATDHPLPLDVPSGQTAEPIAIAATQDSFQPWYLTPSQPRTKTSSPTQTSPTLPRDSSRKLDAEMAANEPPSAPSRSTSGTMACRDSPGCEPDLASAHFEACNAMPQQATAAACVPQVGQPDNAPAAPSDTPAIGQPSAEQQHCSPPLPPSPRSQQVPECTAVGEQLTSPRVDSLAASTGPEAQAVLVLGSKPHVPHVAASHDVDATAKAKAQTTMLEVALAADGRSAAAVVVEADGQAWLAVWKVGDDWQDGRDSRRTQLRLPLEEDEEGTAQGCQGEHGPALPSAALQLLDLRAFGGSSCVAAIASSLAQPTPAVAAAAEGVHLFDLTVAAPVHTSAAHQRRVGARAPAPQLLAMPCRCTCVLSAGSGALFAGGVDGSIYGWQAVAGAPGIAGRLMWPQMPTLVAPPASGRTSAGAVQHLWVAQHQPLLMGARHDGGCICIWDIHRHELLLHFELPGCVSFHPIVEPRRKSSGLPSVLGIAHVAATSDSLQPRSAANHTAAADGGHNSGHVSTPGCNGKVAASDGCVGLFLVSSQTVLLLRALPFEGVRRLLVAGSTCVAACRQGLSVLDIHTPGSYPRENSSALDGKDVGAMQMIPHSADLVVVAAQGGLAERINTTAPNDSLALC